MFKHLKPLFIVSSRTISFFEIFSPINISAITLFAVVLSKEELDEETKNHETIHFQQYLECLVFGFIILYLTFWIRNIIGGMRGSEAYFNIPFEIEAYSNEKDLSYCKSRKSFSWTKYI